MPTPSRALLLATDGELIEGRYLPSLLPLVDRPFLQHVVERLADSGILAVDIVIVRRPERVEALLGDGSRWGLTVAYHLAADSDQANVLMRAVAAAAPPDELLLIGLTDCLPIFPLKPCLESAKPFVVVDSASGHWQGWALLPGRRLAASDFRPDHDVIENLLFEQSGCTVLPVSLTLSARSLTDLLTAQKTLLDQAYPGLLRTGREIEPGVHLSRNVAIHHSVTVIPPIFIGQDCRIAAGAEIGPYAVIGDGCIVDEGATVAESLILAGSYLGEEVEVVQSVIDRNRLMNVSHGATIVLTDRMVLGDLGAPGAAWGVAASLAERLTGLVMLVAALPLLAVVALARGATAGAPLIHRWDVVAAPVSPVIQALPTTAAMAFLPQAEATQADGWRHLLLVFLPGLVQVLGGGVHIVGVPMLTPAQVERLDPDWRGLYLRARIGLISERFVTYGPNPTVDEAYSADAFYVVTASFRHKLALFCRYVSRVVAPRVAQVAEAGTRI